MALENKTFQNLDTQRLAYSLGDKIDGTDIPGLNELTQKFETDRENILTETKQKLSEFLKKSLEEGYTVNNENDYIALSKVLKLAYGRDYSLPAYSVLSDKFGDFSIMLNNGVIYLYDIVSPNGLSRYSTGSLSGFIDSSGNYVAKQLAGGRGRGTTSNIPNGVDRSDYTSNNNKFDYEGLGFPIYRHVPSGFNGNAIYKDWSGNVAIGEFKNGVLFNGVQISNIGLKIEIKDGAVVTSAPVVPPAPAPVVPPAPAPVVPPAPAPVVPPAPRKKEYAKETPELHSAIEDCIKNLTVDNLKKVSSIVEKETKSIAGDNIKVFQYHLAKLDPSIAKILNKGKDYDSKELFDNKKWSKYGIDGILGKDTKTAIQESIKLLEKVSEPAKVEPTKTEPKPQITEQIKVEPAKTLTYDEIKKEPAKAYKLQNGDKIMYIVVGEGTADEKNTIARELASKVNQKVRVELRFGDHYILPNGKMENISTIAIDEGYIQDPIERYPFSYKETKIFSINGASTEKPRPNSGTPLDNSGKPKINTPTLPIKDNGRVMSA